MTEMVCSSPYGRHYVNVDRYGSRVTLKMLGWIDSPEFAFEFDEARALAKALLVHADAAEGIETGTPICDRDFFEDGRRVGRCQRPRGHEGPCDA